MASYLTLMPVRTTIPDPTALLAAIKAATSDATAVIVRNPDGTYRAKKATAWTAPDVTAAQNVLETTAEFTPQVAAQQTIDRWPIEYRALVLALIDQLNVIRSKLSPPLADITPAQALQAIRNKAGTLS